MSKLRHTKTDKVACAMSEDSDQPGHPPTYGENLIARCSQVHDNFTMGVNRKILINLIYLFIQETYLTCANGL